MWVTASGRSLPVRYPKTAYFERLLLSGQEALAKIFNSSSCRFKRQHMKRGYLSKCRTPPLQAIP